MNSSGHLEEERQEVRLAGLFVTRLARKVGPLLYALDVHLRSNKIAGQPHAWWEKEEVGWGGGKGSTEGSMSDGWRVGARVLPSHLFPVFKGRLATPGILPEHLNRGHITRFLSLRPPIPILVRY